MTWGAQRRRGRFVLSEEDGLVSHYKDRGAWVPEEQRWFEAGYAKLDSPWRLESAERIVPLGGRGVLIPDYVLRHEDGREALLEIVWSWRSAGLKRHATLLGKHGPANLILAVSENLRVSQEGPPPAPGRHDPLQEGAAAFVRRQDGGDRRTLSTGVNDNVNGAGDSPGWTADVLVGRTGIAGVPPAPGRLRRPSCTSTSTSTSTCVRTEGTHKHVRSDMEHLLLDPIDIGPITVPNRIVMPAMHLNFTMGGEVTDQLIDFYRARAEGGAGLIIIGGCAIDTVGGFFFLIGMHEDRFVPGLKRFVDEVSKDNDVRLCAQLYQAGRYAFSAFTQQQPIAPSPLGSAYNKETPREMTKEDIATVQQSFVDAARRAKEAGFHAVEILGSAGYLISQFISPASNKRTDEYGGSLENRARFGVEIVRRVKAEVGEDMAVLIRVAGNDFVPGGHANAESAQAARLFQEAGVDAINVTGGWHESRVPQITMGVPEGAYTYLAAGIRANVDVPVISSNRLGDPLLAAQVLANGHADLIAMGRPLIADPDLPNKVAQGQVDAIRPCIACNQGCFDHVFQGTPAECMLNPQAGHESDRVLEAASAPKKIVVVGAGPGGAEAARVAALRGT